MAVKFKIKIKEKQSAEPIGKSIIGDEKGALRAAKQGAKANVKSQFKAKVAEAKISMPKQEAKSVIGEERKNYMTAKKEIRKYTDY